jgi:hypothetical protein
MDLTPTPTGEAIATKPCPRCLGCGQLANSDDREPWSAWEALPPGSDLAVQLGIVQPEDCDECHGKGTVPVEPSPQQVLDLALDPSNDSGADSIRGYLIALLGQLWHHGEDYVKRPFGNSGWQDDLYKPLVKAGYLPGTFDEDGELDEIDYRAGERVIVAAIKALGTVGPAPANGSVRDDLARAITVWAAKQRGGLVDLGDLLETAVMPIVAAALLKTGER